MLIISLYLLFIRKNWFFICLKVFKEADVFSLSYEVPTYDKALLDLFYDEEALIFDRSNV